MENNKELVKLLNKISQILGSEDERFTNLLNQLKTSINPTNIAREAESLAMKLIEERYGKFVETPFYKAWTNGGVYLFDEMDASDATVILNINSALANGYYEFPIGLKRNIKTFIF